jgi:hypothetical protein
MPKIMVLSDGQTWDSIDGCMEITLCEEELEKLCMTDRFSSDIKIQEQRTLSSDDTDWEEVCASFYHACGGAYGGCGDLRSIDRLCQHYALFFEEEYEDESDE